MRERQQRIYELVNKQGSATIEQLKNAAFASEATIRRDLDKMEKQGMLLRVWGGAISANKTTCDPPSFLRSTTNINAKKKIAHIATKALGDNMCIFLPSGSTVSQLARLLSSFKNITVITPCTEIVDLLKNYPSAKIICLGGELHEGHDYTGNLTLNNIENFNADIMFFSCSGLTADGFTSQDSHRLDIIKMMQKNSNKTVLLADTSKVGKKYIYKGFEFDKIDLVIMEKVPNHQELVKNLGKKLITQ